MKTPQSISFIKKNGSLIGSIISLASMICVITWSIAQFEQRIDNLERNNRNMKIEMKNLNDDWEVKCGFVRIGNKQDA